MPKSLPHSSPTLNRLRAAAGLIPIIESGLADGKLSPERAALMASFCEWAKTLGSEDEGEQILVENVSQGLVRLKNLLAV